MVMSTFKDDSEFSSEDFNIQQPLQVKSTKNFGNLLEPQHQHTSSTTVGRSVCKSSIAGNRLLTLQCVTTLCLILTAMVLPACEADKKIDWKNVNMSNLYNGTFWDTLDLGPFLGKDLCGEGGKLCNEDFKKAVSNYKHGESVRSECQEDPNAINAEQVCWIRQKFGPAGSKHTRWEMQFWVDKNDKKTSYCRWAAPEWNLRRGFLTESATNKVFRNFRPKPSYWAVCNLRPSYTQKPHQVGAATITSIRIFAFNEKWSIF